MSYGQCGHNPALDAILGPFTEAWLTLRDHNLSLKAAVSPTCKKASLLLSLCPDTLLLPHLTVEPCPGDV